MSARAYPIPHPEPGNDPRFTHGLTYDIGKVLEAHGFPPVKNGTDAVDLMMALFRFLYASEDRPVPGAVKDARAPLTLEEYRSALAYWEQHAIAANTAGNRAEFDRRMNGVAALRGSIRRLQGGPAFLDDKAPALLQRCEIHVGLDDEQLADLAAYDVHAGVTR